MKLKYAFLVLVLTSLFGQTKQGSTDADQIADLISGLSNHSKAPADVLDPNLTSSQRLANLKRFGNGRFQLNLVPTGGIGQIEGNSTSIPVHVHYEAENGDQLDANATAQFVRRNGIWYFSNFDFMKWPTVLIAVLIVGLLTGIAYATTVLVLRRRLRRKGPLGIKNVKIFLPLFWPELFKQTR